MPAAVKSATWEAPRMESAPNTEMSSARSTTRTRRGRIAMAVRLSSFFIKYQNNT